MSIRKPFIFRIVLVFVLAIGTFIVIQPIVDAIDSSNNQIVDDYELNTSRRTHETSVLFTGDVMLARDVEAIMNRYGQQYPFEVFRTLPPFAAVVGNFEAAIPVNHTMTLPPSTVLSVPMSVTGELEEAGFTHMSLANNHSFDFDFDGYTHTKTTLRVAGIETFGHPTEVASSSVSYIDVNGKTIAIIGVHTLFTNIPFTALDTLMLGVNRNSDLQIVYVHWGEEYELQHSPQQAQLADTLIQLGADLIIGHHPHVVQDIGMIRGVPVLYSLGNFIFDQYFSTEVQEGLLVVLEVTDEPQIKLLPVTTATSRTQPQLMALYERDRFLQALSKRSSNDLSQWIAEGTIPLKENLASSQENAIMAQ